jgi:MFS family permease
MLPLLLSALPLFTAAALYIAGSMLLGTSLALRLTVEGTSSSVIGLILVQYSFGFVVGSRVGPMLIGRVGHIRVYAAFAAIACCAALVHAAFVDPWLWGGLRALSGFSAAAMMVALESWINAFATARTRGALFGFYMVNYYLAGAAGQWLVAAFAPQDFRGYSLAAGLLVLSSVPLALTRRAAPAAIRNPRMKITELLRVSPVSVWSSATAGFAIGSFYALAPTVATRLGYPHGTVARYMATAVLASMFLQWPLGRLADRMDRRRVIFGLAAGAGLLALLLAFVADLDVRLLFATTMAYTGLVACLYPASLALAHDQTHGNDGVGNVVGANAGLLLCYGIGTCVGPPLTSLAISLRGPTGLYLALSLVLALFALWLRRALQAPVETSSTIQQPFVPVAVEAITVDSRLDPRSPPSPDETAREP